MHEEKEGKVNKKHRGRQKTEGEAAEDKSIYFCFLLSYSAIFIIPQYFSNILPLLCPLLHILSLPHHHISLFLLPSF